MPQGHRTDRSGDGKITKSEETCQKRKVTTRTKCLLREREKKKKKAVSLLCLCLCLAPCSLILNMLGPALQALPASCVLTFLSLRDSCRPARNAQTETTRLTATSDRPESQLTEIEIVLTVSPQSRIMLQISKAPGRYVGMQLRRTITFFNPRSATTSRGRKSLPQAPCWFPR